jgi:hypothetical protein
MGSSFLGGYPMCEPNPRATIFATAAQHARLTWRTAAPVSQRSEERWVEDDIEAQPLPRTPDDCDEGEVRFVSAAFECSCREPSR